MDIIIRSQNCKDYNMNIDNIETVLDLKERIKNDLNLKTTKQQLYYMSKELIDEKKIKDYHFKKGDIIVRFCKNSGG